MGPRWREMLRGPFTKRRGWVGRAAMSASDGPAGREPEPVAAAGHDAAVAFPDHEVPPDATRLAIWWSRLGDVERHGRYDDERAVWQREADAEARTAVLDAQEQRIQRRESYLAARSRDMDERERERARAADERDRRADERERLADERERMADERDRLAG
jgi:hypothetical protein